ncbi:methylated-DNA--[protein]-cysteine S-methyltransferase [Streptomyces sp. NPDC015171]|uniref:methylated-DNA--[protein]-cysteine S-methyltransferase n=1 Tax=Streptomyces sp. NPDC015171 TaxID=3364945 RepID=UPI0036F55082
MMELEWFTVSTPLPTGSMRVAVTAQGVAAAAFNPRESVGLPPGTELADPAGDRRAAAVAAQFADYFAGRRQDLDLPVDWRLTSGVQRTVLRTLHRSVGWGRTITYGGLADLSGAFEPGLPAGAPARTVGSIAGSCPISLLVPCHRVVAADGLGGFGGGAEGMAVKRWLLTREGVLDPELDWTG